MVWNEYHNWLKQVKSDKPLNLCGKFQATLTAETFYVAKDDIMSAKSH